MNAPTARVTGARRLARVTRAPGAGRRWLHGGRLVRIPWIPLLIVAMTWTPAVAQDPTDPPGVVLDFQDAELRLVLSALAEAGGLNVIYGEIPDRRVTLRMDRRVAPEEVPDLLRSVARANGLTLEEEGGLITLSASGAAATEPETEAETPQAPALRLYVYRLRHVRAPRIAATLQGIFGGGGGGAGGSGGGAAAARRGLSTPSLSEGLRQQRIEPVDPSAPEVVVELGEQTTPSIPVDLTAEVMVVPDEVTNSLLVRAAEQDWEIVEQAIQALDLRPMQVLIEVVIAELRRTSDLDIGLSTEAGDSGDDHDVSIGVGVAGAASRSAGDLVLDVIRSGPTNVHSFFSALATEGTVRVLSRPVLVAQNNQEARILIGDERPFIQVFRSLPTDAAVRDQVVQYRDVGTVLTILPTINPDGYVNLELSQEVSTATAETQFGAPIISTRETSTHLFVRDGQTVVIGGLVDRQETHSESGVPLLKDIPLLGNLFKSQSTNTSRSELFLFVTPRILAEDEDHDALLEDVERRLNLPDTAGVGR